MFATEGCARISRNSKFSSPWPTMCWPSGKCWAQQRMRAKRENAHKQPGAPTNNRNTPARFENNSRVQTPIAPYTYSKFRRQFPFSGEGYFVQCVPNGNKRLKALPSVASTYFLNHYPQLIKGRNSTFLRPVRRAPRAATMNNPQ